jgi:hypothetical protein
MDPQPQPQPQPQPDGVRMPERPDLAALQAMLFDWRDALVDVSQALHALRCEVDPAGQQRARDAVDQLLKKFTGS